MFRIVGQYLPSCDEDGYYRSHQCHSSSSQCWCVDRYGNEIAGSRTHGPTNCGRQEYLTSQSDQNIVVMSKVKVCLACFQYNVVRVDCFVLLC